MDYNNYQPYNSYHAQQNPSHSETFGIENLSLDPDVLLHGVLEICIFNARRLPSADVLGSCDPFVEVFAFPTRLAKTTYRKNNRNPDWDERFVCDVLVGSDTKHIEFRVYDKDYNPTQDDLVCTVFISAEEVANGNRIEGTFPCMEGNKPGRDCGATLSLAVQYWSLNQLENVIRGHEVPNSYFKLLKGNRVKLYTDAHVPTNLLAPVPMASGMQHVAHKCWEDIYMAIDTAQLFIYIAGWSVYSEISLLRVKPLTQDGMLTIGELLKKKAKEGVKVCVMVWNEALSVSMGKTSTAGLMATHDEETKKYFQGTGVKVFLCPREGQDDFSQDTTKHSGLISKAYKLIQKTMESTLFVGINYTHHQKTVIIDQPALTDASKRRIVAFVGGLDLTDGRWDTPDHPLFSTLNTYHKGDFHQGIPGMKANIGPRQPWHDIHSLVEGPTARHVMFNFLERWEQQNHNQIGSLYDQEEAMRNGIVVSEDEEVVPGHEQWGVQVLRSIDGRSCNFNRGDQQVLKLQAKKGRAVDSSIQRAYVHHIRRAQKFIYIENQYFLGSSQVWETPQKGASHLIPWEIAQKIRQKIFAGERFAAYIIVPLFPEGDPETAAMKEILHWQYRTVQMMYRKIADAIKKKGINAHPTDYLNIFCLGQRELGPVPDMSGLQGPAKRIAMSRRQMIYVHSKMMIVDDEVAIVGTANINQRSMDGARDTEIAVATYQLAHTVERAGGVLPKGEVHGFRMTLWQEHMKVLEPSFYDPSSVECARRVRQIGQFNWGTYSELAISPMVGHLMTYPYAVESDGNVTALPGHESFPDFPRSLVIGQVTSSIDFVSSTARLLTM